MSWLSLIVTALSLVKSLVGFMERRAMVDSVRATVAIEGLEKTLEAIELAGAARAAAAADVDRNGLPVNDPHRRD